jgi:hypothetical protein
MERILARTDPEHELQKVAKIRIHRRVPKGVKLAVGDEQGSLGAYGFMRWERELDTPQPGRRVGRVR